MSERIGMLAGYLRGSEVIIRDLLALAGIEIGGSGPLVIRVHDDRFYDRVLSQGAFGLAESYVDGWWDCDRLDQVICRMFEEDLIARIPRDWRTATAWLRAQLLNLQTVTRASQVAHAHYDLGNEFFAAMLGRSMIYSCGYWTPGALGPEATSLDEAQDRKLELICKKLDLGPADHVLDIGCGWGGFARWAAERVGARVTGVTVSEPQAAFARAHCKGLPVDIQVLDYRSSEMIRRGPFTKVVSIGMFEHVGNKNYRRFMQIARAALGPENRDGRMLLHTIGRSGWCERFDPWVDRYLFPNGMLPSMDEISMAAARRFVIEDWHNFGADYDKTLMAWHANFERAIAEKNPCVPESVRFQRMWRYYLLAFAGSFRSRVRMQLWQVVLSTRGVRSGYRSIR
jgi:cyclopropane-fatty-acyl-phospholipid synthase